MASTEAATAHHFSLPFQYIRPRMNRKMVMAPMYMGPAVKGWGPQ